MKEGLELLEHKAVYNRAFFFFSLFWGRGGEGGIFNKLHGKQTAVCFQCTCTILILI